MTLKSLPIAVALCLAAAGCSSDASVSTTGGAIQTTSTQTTATTTGSEQTSTAAAPSTTAAPATTTTAVVPEVIEVEISYRSGAVDGGGRIDVPLGEPVVIRIQSDVSDEGHLHGYDIFVDLEPGSTGVIEFVADIPGIFELELEDSGVLLADLEVAP